MSGFLDAMAATQDQEDAVDGIKALVRLYYTEYTDAERIEEDLLHPLRGIEDVLNTVGSTMFTLAEVVSEVEAELRSDTGRKMRTFDTEEG